MSAPTIPPIDPIRLHQGGWDEILLIAAPLLIFWVLSWLAARRNKRRKGSGPEQ